MGGCGGAVGGGHGAVGGAVVVPWVVAVGSTLEQMPLVLFTSRMLSPLRETQDTPTCARRLYLRPTLGEVLVTWPHRALLVMNKFFTMAPKLTATLPRQ